MYRAFTGSAFFRRSIAQIQTRFLATNKKSPPRMGHIYLANYVLDPSTKDALKHSEDRLLQTKIGYVKGGIDALKKRKSTFQTASPIDIEIEAYHCKNPNEAEKYLHDLFKAKKGTREWFQLTQRDRTTIASIMQILHKDWILMGKMNPLKGFNAKPKTAHKPPKDDTCITQTHQEQMNAILAKHKDLLAIESIKNASRSYLDEEEFQLVRGILNHHPKSNEKIGCGVAEIFVAEVDNRNVARCQNIDGHHSTKIEGSPYRFHIERNDGSEEKFCHMVCVRRFLEDHIIAAAQ